MTQFVQSDIEWMARAIWLAKRGRFTTTPNPNVGCVLVNPEGELVGEGWHQKAGEGHAEVNALAQAKEQAAGCTAYVTLEPCSHTGKTPPCADALIAAGVKRVVVAMQDPNPKVAGRGLKRIAEQGIQVDVGLLQEEAEALNPGFLHRMRTGKPHVTLKLAASLDAKTALSNGQSQWITGPEARRDVQLHRAMSCGILSGSGTVLTDNPSLNVRPEALPGVDLPTDELRQPLRIVVDGQNRLHPELKLLGLPGETLLLNRQHDPKLQLPNVQQWQAPLQGEQLSLPEIMQELGRRQLNQIWVEAGAGLAGALMQQQLVDEFILYLAPKLMGQQSKGLLTLPVFEHMDQVPDMAWKDVSHIGNDLKLTLTPNY